MTIKRKQVPIEPGSAITMYKTQGKTMERVIVDLASCSGTEQPYVMISRAMSLGGLMVLHDFQAHQIKKRQSEELWKEFSRLLHLKWRTIARYGTGPEVEEAKVRVEEDAERTRAKGTKQKGGSGYGGKSKRKRTHGTNHALRERRSWALPLAGATDYQLLIETIGQRTLPIPKSCSQLSHH